VIASLVVAALLVMCGADCASPCETYCEMQADCMEDLFDGDWTYSGYIDGDEYYEQCLDWYDIGGGVGIDRTENNACKIALRIFDDDLCS
jgi:hypothetical protein